MSTEPSIENQKSRINNSPRCLVLGGSGSLGRTVCRTLARMGARVAFTWCAREEVAKELLAELPGGMALQLDITQSQQVERVVDEVAGTLGGLDALIHCIAIGVTSEEFEGRTTHHRIEQIDESGWDLMMAVNAKSAFLAARQALKFLRNASGGNIVLTGSIDGIKLVPAPIHYAASKAALSGLARSMAKEFGKCNIRVNLVAPGVMEAGLSRSLPENLLAEYRKHCGLKRVGRLDEIASVIAWLALENTYVTGQTLVVDGAL